MTKDKLLEAAKKVVPDSWMHEPNLDLDGQTPQKVLDQGQIDDVIQALWQAPNTGPVS